MSLRLRMGTLEMVSKQIHVEGALVMDPVQEGNQRLEGYSNVFPLSTNHIFVSCSRIFDEVSTE